MSKMLLYHSVSLIDRESVRERANAFSHANHVNYGHGRIISYRSNMISNDRRELQQDEPSADWTAGYMAKI